MENNGEKERGREEGKEKECDEKTLAFRSADLGTRATEEIGDGAKARGERERYIFRRRRLNASDIIRRPKPDPSDSPPAPPFFRYHPRKRPSATSSSLVKSRITFLL